MMKNWADKTTLTFDCYGTLIDWESGIWDGFQALLQSNNSQMKRHACLEAFAKVESAIQARNPAMLYEEVLYQAHKQFAEIHHLQTTEALDRRFGDYVPYWPAFPDSADSLRALKSRYKLVILSNVSRASFAASNARLGVEFDAIYTAEDVGSYKPNPANFAYMLRHLDTDLSVQPEAVLHVAQSLFHDIQPATIAGLPTIWIDRQNLAGGGSWGATAKTETQPQADMRFADMNAFTRYALGL